MEPAMIRSMTGFGEAVHASHEGTLRVEIKAVNHRFLNTVVRAPQGFDRLDQEIQAWLRPHMTRGHVQVIVSIEGGSAGANGGLPELDIERARHYANLLRRLRDELELPGGPDVTAVARFGEIFKSSESTRAAASVDPALLRQLVEAAAKSVVVMREAEGQRLRDDMEARLSSLEHQLARVTARAPERLTRERDRLRSAIRELTEQAEVDDDRLAREVAYMAERWDLNEEIVRFRSHLSAFREGLAQEGGEAVGKRLSFLVQEMHREVNTMAAKANDADITRATVVMKEEIERLREQIENVE
jgi:uncharacterized protein (TIGR00255 family)